MPAPPTARTGTRPGDDLLVLYEIPLFRRDEPILPWEMVGRVRRRQEAGEVRVRSAAQVDRVLGAPLVRLPDAVPVEELPEDRAHTLLTTLNRPEPGDEERAEAESLLVGFLYLREGRMRLYVRHRDEPEVVACDVRLAEAGPAVIAEVFSRSQERELYADPGDDPHCAAVVDLTH
ncbi:hypothetical protein RM863_28050 [Streptomyces sp. DSM 41014]|uniref:Uncharacterized protein n=1 Tax=Streptomyces hintoniae TaxID=3075521 RepID=A0ABU2URR9_9ACTN|nr:hypothetical protein [Streptomyces sp. DSM 41014]MDT0475982.1 hypothetical protein [Streptomyces sp. DSM 41014]